MPTNGKILVLGDVMLDVCIKGVTKRLSPEAPCPVLESCSLPLRSLGGAGNVSKYISHSGYEVDLCGCIGNDIEGQCILDLLNQSVINNHLDLNNEGQTTSKTRYLTYDNHQLLRVDRDFISHLSDLSYRDILRKIDSSIYDVVILSDYDKGILSEDICKEVIKKCNQNNIPIVVDIKNSFVKFYGASIIKGNKKEMSCLCEKLSIDFDNNNLDETLKNISHKLNCELVVMTMGGYGLAGYSRSEGFIKCNADNLPYFDVTGAGDIVTAAIAMLIIGKDMSTKDVLFYANKAAQARVSLSKDHPIKLLDILSNNKHLYLNDLKYIREGKKIVFTNGCFDIIHAGHVSLLERAKQLGDILIVAINSDESIKRLKGSNRPINQLEDRISVLRAMSCIDYIIPFEEDTPLNLIRDIKPDVLIKGGDYLVTEIVGADYVKSYNGSVYSLPLYGNLSSSSLLEKSHA